MSGYIVVIEVKGEEDVGYMVGEILVVVWGKSYGSEMEVVGVGVGLEFCEEGILI